MPPGLGSAADRAATLLYGCAHYGKSLFWYASEFLFAFFLTEVGAIPAARMGWVLATGLLLSAAIDLLAGARLSRRLPSAASAGRLQLAGACASAASLALMFACSRLPGDMRLAGMLVMSLSFRSSYALYDIPQNALLSLATTSSRARTNVAAMRYVFSGLAALTVACTLPALLQTAADRATRFVVVAIVFAGLAVLSAALLAWKLRAMPASPSMAINDTMPRRPLDGDIRLLIVLMFVMTLAAPVFAKIEPYFAAFVLRDPLMGGGIVMAVSIGMVLGQPLWAALARRSSRLGMIATTAGAIVAAAIGFLLASRIGGMSPLVAAVGFGAASGGVGMALWAAYGDAVARGAKGCEGWAYGLFTASAKLSLAASGLLVGMLLARIDYRGTDSEMLIGMMVTPPIVAGLNGAALTWCWQVRRGGTATHRALSERTRP